MHQNFVVRLFLFTFLCVQVFVGSAHAGTIQPTYSAVENNIVADDIPDIPDTGLASQLDGQAGSRLWVRDALFGPLALPGRQDGIRSLRATGPPAIQ